MRLSPWVALKGTVGFGIATAFVGTAVMSSLIGTTAMAATPAETASMFVQCESSGEFGPLEEVSGYLVDNLPPSTNVQLSVTAVASTGATHHFSTTYNSAANGPTLDASDLPYFPGLSNLSPQGFYSPGTYSVLMSWTDGLGDGGSRTIPLVVRTCGFDDSFPVAGLAPTPDGQGYYEVNSNGDTAVFGEAAYWADIVNNKVLLDVALRAPIVGIVSTPSALGYWMVAGDGGVFAFGNAAYEGSTGDIHLNKPVVAMGVTPDDRGYWLVAADGGVFAFGDAPFYGSMGGQYLGSPIVGMAATPDGKGYYLVGADGGVFAFGDATYQGSMATSKISKPVVGISVDPVTGGYWEAGADGGVFAFDAPFLGSAANIRLNRPVIGISGSPSGEGYRLVASDGGIFDYGDAQYLGSTVGQSPGVAWPTREPAGAGPRLLVAALRPGWTAIGVMSMAVTPSTGVPEGPVGDREPRVPGTL